MNSKETNEILKEILKWQKFQGREILKKKIREGNLFTDKKYILVYHYSDGDKSSRQISKITGIGYKKVQSLWKEWISLGLAEPSEKYGGGRCKRLFEVKDLGLELPKVKTKVNKNVTK